MSFYSDEMSKGEHTGHALSVAVLVVGGVFAKSAILNWIIGPATVVLSVAAVVAVERRLVRRRETR